MSAETTQPNLPPIEKCVAHRKLSPVRETPPVTELLAKSDVTAEECVKTMVCIQGGGVLVEPALSSSAETGECDRPANQPSHLLTE